jgi:hypothetical protein
MKTLHLLLVAASACIANAGDVDTKFLVPGKPIFKADFNDGQNPGKPLWQLRKSKWTVNDGVLHGVNDGGNGPFIRLHSKENGGVLPEDYIMKFSFKIDERPGVEKKKNKYHATRSSGHRFSFGHYAAKYQWRPDIGMDIAIMHGHALQDDRFHIEKGKWYHVTVEICGDEILTWFKDGPAYFMEHEVFRSKPSGWEFFVHETEIGQLDNLEVWSLAGGSREYWKQTLAGVRQEKRVFLSSENPGFKITKEK